MSDISISSPTGGVATNDPKNIPDMTAFVQQSLTDMQNKFTNMSDQVKNPSFYILFLVLTNLLRYYLTWIFNFKTTKKCKKIIFLMKKDTATIFHAKTMMKPKFLIF